MAAVKKILMVDDDADLREALADQLVLTEEFDVFEAGDGAGRPRPRPRAALRPRDPRRRPARHGRPRALPADAQAGRQVPDPDADRPRHRQRPDPRASTPAPTTMSPSRSSCRCCSPASAPSSASTSSPRTRSSASAPTASARRRSSCSTRRSKKIRLTEKETNILKYLYRAGSAVVRARRAAARGLGLQRRRHHPHARDPHLPPAPEDRARPGQRPDPRHRARRLPAGALTACEHPSRSRARHGPQFRGRPRRGPAARSKRNSGGDCEGRLR